MKKETLVTDIDSVLDNLMPSLNAFYNRTHGTNLRLKDYVYYDLEKVWGGSKKEAVDIVTQFYNSPDFEMMSSMEFSQKGIQLLSKDYRIIAVTSRPEFTRKKTERRFSKRYPNVEKIFFTGDYSKSFDKMSKLEICLRENARIIVDDHPLIALECSSHGLTSFLFGEGWKKDTYFKEIKTDGVILAKDWREVLHNLI